MHNAARWAGSVHARETAVALVIKFTRSGKDMVKDFVICFTSRPGSVGKWHVIAFLNLPGCPYRLYGAASRLLHYREA